MFTDINMPGAVDGLELVRQVHCAWPHIALLVASGRVSPRQDELPEGSRFLPKPYDYDQLVRNARTLVGAEARFQRPRFQRP